MSELLQQRAFGEVSVAAWAAWVLCSGVAAASAPAAGVGAPGVPAAVTAPVAPRGAAPGQEQQQPERYFGYAVGEERRYVLEPSEALRAGEYARWLIRLDRVEGEGRERVVIFEIGHERDEVISEWVNPGSRLVAVRVDGEVRVNAYGFPVQVSLEEQQVVGGEHGSTSDLRTTTYRFADGVYRKEVHLSGQDWSFRVPIARGDNVDLGVPRGLYLFLPSGLLCLGESIGNQQPQPLTARTGCGYTDPALANPGLLSLVVPVLRESPERDIDVTFFMPAGVGTRPAGLIDMRRWVNRERDSVGNLSRYYQRTGLELQERTEVEVGPRTLPAWKIDIGGSMRDVWVDDDGRVLRIDIDPHPRLLRARWMRLQFPSEY